jgi:hypothetical protein
MLRQLGRDEVLVSDQNDLDVRLELLEGSDRARDFRRRRVIGAHRVQGDAHRLAGYSTSVSRTGSPR